MALESYDCYLFSPYSFPTVMGPSHVTFKIPAVRTKNIVDVSLIFSEKNQYFYLVFYIKMRVDYISSKKNIFYFYNIHSVNVHNQCLHIVVKIFQSR